MLSSEKRQKKKTKKRQKKDKYEIIKKVKEGEKRNRAKTQTKRLIKGLWNSGVANQNIFLPKQNIFPGEQPGIFCCFFALFV
jgi:hypothetical protein